MLPVNLKLFFAMLQELYPLLGDGVDEWPVEVGDILGIKDLTILPPPVEGLSPTIW